LSGGDHGQPEVLVDIDRYCRSLDQENVYQHAYDDLTSARVGVGAHVTHYNGGQWQVSLGRRTPDPVYPDEEPSQFMIARHVLG